MQVRQLAEIDKEIDGWTLNPKWSDERVHNWHNYVSDEVKAMWHTFTDEQKRALQKQADYQSSQENWD